MNIRSVTGLLTLDDSVSDSTLHALRDLSRAARDRFTEAGFQVQTVRVARVDAFCRAKGRKREDEMMIQVITADKNVHAAQVEELFWEYLQWANPRVNEEFGVSFDIKTMLDTDMQHLEKFMPPNGRLLLGYVDDQLAGCACLKYLAPRIGEFKRMYVRPGNRKCGMGRALINQLVAEAARVGYERIRLDSARFMKEAHHLYRTTGFNEIEAYEGSEVPKDFQKHWIFMEMELGKEKHK